MAAVREAAPAGSVSTQSAPVGSPAPPPSAEPGRRRRSVDALVVVALIAVAAAVFLQAVETVPFHGDESEWISNGRYFSFLFLEGDVTSSVWRPSWLNRDQPPLGRYIIGGIVWASGSDPTRVNRSYAWERDLATNRREGRVPGPELLLPVRRTMAIVGALAVGLLYAAGRLLAGRVVGVIAALLAVASPLIQVHVVQARTEALLAIFSAAALVALLALARSYARTGRPAGPGRAVGLLLGLALATKLTAAVAIVAACAFGGLAALARLRAAPDEAVRLLVWSAASGLLATAVWVGVNPFLWPDPVGRTWSMLAQQQSIMVEQGQMFGNPVEAALPERLWLVVRRSFVDNSTPSFDYGGEPGGEPTLRRTFLPLPTVGPISLELALAALGALVLLRRAGATWAARRRLGVDAALACWLGAFLLGIGANLSLDWPRYYVTTAYFGTLLIALGVQAIVQAVAPGALRRWVGGAAPPAERHARAAG